MKMFERRKSDDDGRRRLRLERPGKRRFMGVEKEEIKADGVREELKCKEEKQL